MSKSIEVKLREAIAAELKNVTVKNAPKIFSLIQTEKGYKEIEEKIITMMIRFNFTASSCIPQLEVSL